MASKQTTPLSAVFNSVPDRREYVPPLSARELEILAKIAHGKRNGEIAIELGLSASTVRIHLTNAYRKLGVRSRMEAVGVARERGLLPLF